MILPRFIRKLLAVLRGSVAPPLIFMSVLTGFWFGMMPGFSGLHTVLIVIVLVLNVHIGLFLLSLGLGKALALAAAPVLYHVGGWVQEYLAGLLSALSSIPIIGMTDFGRYALAGGLILGPIVGAVAGLALAFSVVNFRRMMVKLDGKSEKFRVYYSKFWVRILDRVLIGKRTKDVKSMFAKAKYIRKVGVVLAVLVVGGFFAASHFLQDTVIKKHTTKTLTRVNGAQVDLENLSISLLGGDVAAAGLQVTDANKPSQNQVVVEKVAANASVYDLLLGRVVMDNVEVTGMKFNQARETPGEVVEAPTPEEEPFDPNEQGISQEDVAKLEKYFKDAKKAKQWLQKIRQWLPEGKDKDPNAVEEAPQTYLEYLRAKAAESPTVKVLAKQILADKVEIPSELFGSSEIKMTNLSDAPDVLGEPVTLSVKSHETPTALNVTMDYSKGDSPAVSGKFEGFDLSKVQSNLGQDAGIAFQSGTASGTFTGMLTKEMVDLTVEVQLSNLKATSQGDGVLGLGAEQTSQVLEVLKELGTTIRIVGPVTEPRLVFDTRGLTDQFQQALVDAGKERLKSELDNKIQEELGDKVPEQLQDTLKKSGGSIVEGLGGLLGGKKKEENQE